MVPTILQTATPILFTCIDWYNNVINAVNTQQIQLMKSKQRS